MRIYQWVPAFNAQVSASLVAQARADIVSYEYAHADGLARGNGKGWENAWFSTHGCDLVGMRNEAFHKAMVGGYDWLWMQDADTYSTIDGGPLMPMIETCEREDAAACFAIVSMRMDPVRANVWPVRPGKVYELEKAGTGMVVIDLRKIRGWYADYPGPMFGRIYEDAKQKVQVIGQDIFFCRLMRGQGLRIVCDGRIPTVHVNAAHRLPYDGHSDPTQSGSPTAG